MTKNHQKTNNINFTIQNYHMENLLTAEIYSDDCLTIETVDCLFDMEKKN